MGQILLEAILEVLVKGTGYFICRQFNRDIDPDGFVVIAVGMLVVVAFALGGYVVVKEVIDFVAIDRCLDSGGAYDYASGACAH